MVPAAENALCSPRVCDALLFLKCQKAYKTLLGNCKVDGETVFGFVGLRLGGEGGRTGRVKLEPLMIMCFSVPQFPYW